MPGYRRLKAAAHNYIASFLSCMNYVNGQYISVEIKEAFQNSKSNEAIVDMINFKNTSKELLTRRVRQSFEIYSGMLSQQILKQNSEPGKIVSLLVSLKKSPKYGILYEGIMTDDRGKRTKIKVHGD